MKEKLKKNKQNGEENKSKITQIYDETIKLSEESSLKLSEVLKS